MATLAGAIPSERSDAVADKIDRCGRTISNFIKSLERDP